MNRAYSEKAPENHQLRLIRFSYLYCERAVFLEILIGVKQSGLQKLFWIAAPYIKTFVIWNPLNTTFKQLYFKVVYKFSLRTGVKNGYTIMPN